jgi:hypothetical protein
MESFFEVKNVDCNLFTLLDPPRRNIAAMFRGNFPELTLPSTECKQNKHNYLYPVEQRPFILKPPILIICIMRTCGQGKAYQLLGQIIPPFSEPLS